MNNFKANISAGLEAMRQQRYTEAIEFFRLAKEQNRHNVRVCRVLGNCLRTIGSVEDAIKAYQEGLSRRYHSGTHQRLLNALNYTENSQEYIAGEHKKWSAIIMQEIDRVTSFRDVDRKPGDKIRLGYVSSDFKSHPVAYFLMPIYRNHDRDQFEVISYYNGSHVDRITTQFNSYSDAWHQIDHLSTEALYKQIVSDDIDVLIDLSGHTSGNRLDVFALKPAPFQITYIGYPNTTGLDAIDHRIVDSTTDPDSIPESWHSERLYRMPKCFLCFEPPKEKLGVEVAPVMANDYVTFGCFNKVAKITDKMIHAWVAILLRVRNSKLILKARGFDIDKEGERIKQRFLNAGIDDVTRIELYGLVPTRAQHLLMYNKIDIALDTYPYNGTTTTIQSLYMSVPIITLQGESHRSRVSSSFLGSLVLNELIATNTDEYIDKAAQLAGDIQRINKYKTSIRDKLLQSHLVDGPGFVNELEAFYKSLFFCNVNTITT